MVDFTPPPENGESPAPLSMDVNFTYPMVGSFNPFEPVDGNNRDVILEGIRAWARLNLPEWSAAWTAHFQEWFTTERSWAVGLAGELAAEIDAFETAIGVILDEYREQLETAVQQIINSTIEITAPVVAGMLANTANPARIEADKHYRRVVSLTSHVADLDNPPANFGPVVYAAAVEANAGAAFGLVLPIYVPPGVYPITSPIDFGNLSVILTGEGRFDSGPGGLGTITQKWDAGMAGEHGVMRVRVSAQGLNDTDAYDMESIFRPSVTSNIIGIRNGDVLFLDSDEYYAGDFVSGSDASKHTFKAQYFPVSGIGLNVALISGAGGINVDDIVVGATSGARARVRGNRRIVNMAATDVSLMFTEVVDDAGGQASTFINGELLRVNDTDRAYASAPPHLIAPYAMLDLHATGAKLHRKIENPVIVDISGLTFGAIGNTDGTTPSAQRKPLLTIKGVQAPRVSFNRILDGFTRAFQFRGCFTGEAIGNIFDKLVNDSILTYQGYGYGVEVFGSTEGLDVQFTARNTRHPFTTNTTAVTARHTGDDIVSAGVPKFNVVHDCLIVGNVSAAIDEHGGAYGTVIRDNRIVGVLGGRDSATTAAAIQSRGAGTLIQGNKIENVTSGIVARSNAFLYDWDVQTIVKGNTVDNWSYMAYQYGDKSPAATTKKNKTLAMNNSHRGNGESLAVGGNQQNAVIIHSGEIVMMGDVHQRFNGTPILLSVDGGPGAIGQVTLLDQTFDYSESLYTGAPIKLFGTPVGPLTVDNLRLIQGSVSGAGAGGWVQVSGVSGVVACRVGRLVAPMRTNSIATFLYTGSSTAANVEYVGIRSMGNELRGSLNIAAGTATLASIPAQSSVDVTIPVTGVTTNDFVKTWSYSPGALPAGVVLKQARVSAVDTVVLSFQNVLTTASAAGAAGGTWTVTVEKRGGVA